MVDVRETVTVEEEVVALCRHVLEDGTVTVDSTTASVEGWDSLGHMNLITAIEGRYAIELDVMEMAEVDGVRALVAVVQRTLRQR